MSCIDYHKDDESDEVCIVCGGEADYECKQCENPVCDSCTATYNQFTQIDYTLCTNCEESREHQRNLYND